MDKYDFPFMSLFFGFVVIVSIVLVIIANFFKSPKTDFQNWTDTRRTECHGLGGDRFAVTNQTAVCTRKPFMRMPKVLFEKEYSNEKE